MDFVFIFYFYFFYFVSCLLAPTSSVSVITQYTTEELCGVACASKEVGQFINEKHKHEKEKSSKSIGVRIRLG